MRGVIASVVLTLLIADAVLCVRIRSCDDEIFERMEARYAGNNKERSVMAAAYNMTFFDGQRLDHFNFQDNRTWSQRYSSSFEFWGGPGFPIFLAFGGESPIGSRWVTSNHMKQLGVIHKAMLIQLEHRFYGKSQPFGGNVSTASLKYLTSQQALADAALFIKSIMKRYNTPNSPVIVFGCSYPGNLAAWFRMKYPTIAIGAVATSAPVQAVKYMLSYAESVVYGLDYVTGNNACSTKLKQAFAFLEKLTQTTGGVLMAGRMFNTCEPLTSYNDGLQLRWRVMDDTMDLVQLDNGGWPWVPNFCTNMNSIDDPFQALLKAFANSTMDLYDSPCVQKATRKGYLDYLKQQDISPAGNQSTRQWLYQTCVEFGYFQTTSKFRSDPDVVTSNSYTFSPSQNQPYGNVIDNAYYPALCKEVFGLDFNDAAIDNTNAYYGGANIPAINGPSNIFFANGGIDPWHVLSVTQDISPTLLAGVSQRTSHCGSIYPSLTSPDVVALRQRIADTVASWLAPYQM